MFARWSAPKTASGMAKKKIGRGDEFVEAIGVGDVCLRGPQGDQEQQDAGAAHGNHCARSCEEQDKKGYVHGCGRCVQALDHQYSFELQLWVAGGVFGVQGRLIEGLCGLIEGLCSLIEGLCSLIEGLCRAHFDPEAVQVVV